MVICLLLAGSAATAQDPPTPSQPPQPPQPTEPTEPLEPTEPEAQPPVLDTRTSYDDYTVKGYSLTVFGGNFSGGMYLDNKFVDGRTVIADEALGILAFNPNGPLANKDGLLNFSLDTDHYNAAQKEIRPGSAYGVRLGIYVSEVFHLDLTGTYAAGEARTSMIHMVEPDDPATYVRETLDVDEGFKVYMGGLSLIYDARPAEFFGVVPRLGFGLGGVINRYSYLEDKTGLYLAGSFGLTARIKKNIELAALLDVATFAFEVDELGYSNMVSYKTLSLGVNWFIDVIPPAVRASHEADLKD
jgi:hypothetical protein